MIDPDQSGLNDQCEKETTFPVTFPRISGFTTSGSSGDDVLHPVTKIPIRSSMSSRRLRTSSSAVNACCEPGGLFFVHTRVNGIVTSCSTVESVSRQSTRNDLSRQTFGL